MKVKTGQREKILFFLTYLSQTVAAVLKSAEVEKKAKYVEASKEA